MRAVMPSSTSKCCCMSPLRLGHVQHRAHLAGRVVDRHGRAGQAGELGEEMVFAPHRHRAGRGQAGAHAVGAGHGFAPDCAGAQAHGPHLGGKFSRAHHVQDHAVGVGQHHRALAIGQLLVQRGHLVAGAVHHVGHAGQPLFQRTGFHDRQLARTIRVQAVFVQAAAPGAGHHVVAFIAETASDHVQIRGRRDDHCEAKPGSWSTPERGRVPLRGAGWDSVPRQRLRLGLNTRVNLDSRQPARLP